MRKIFAKNVYFNTQVDILPMMETITKMNATQFIDVLDGKEDYINKENITLFLPSNEAFEKFSNHMLETVSNYFAKNY